jgi:hypothetical protein
MNDEGATSSLVAVSATESYLAFYPISLRKLVVMSVCTLGLYEVYWFFCHWMYIRDAERSRLSPVVRAIFPLIFVYPLFRKIRSSAKTTGTPTGIAAGPLALGWIVFKGMGVLPPPFLLLSLLSVLYLLPAQRVANSINAVTDPGHDPNDTFSTWNKIAIVIGGIIVLFAIVGSFVSPK